MRIAGADTIDMLDDPPPLPDGDERIRRGHVIRGRHVRPKGSMQTAASACDEAAGGGVGDPLRVTRAGLPVQVVVTHNAMAAVALDRRLLG